MIATIPEKHVRPAFVAIIWKPLSRDRSDRVDHMETGSRKHRSTFTVAIAAIIWKPAFTSTYHHLSRQTHNDMASKSRRR